MNIKGKSFLITGGTGSFGEKAVHYILKKFKPKFFLFWY